MPHRFFAVLAAAAVTTTVNAAGVSAEQREVIGKLSAKYSEQARAEALKAKRKAEADFSAEVGRKLFLKSRDREGDEIPACATCHTDDPTQTGRHVVSKKPIKPLAPGANPERFTDAAKVEKNFAKHCQEIYNRDCDATEKGHFLAYMLSVK